MSEEDHHQASPPPSSAISAATTRHLRHHHPYISTRHHQASPSLPHQILLCYLLFFLDDFIFLRLAVKKREAPAKKKAPVKKAKEVKDPNKPKRPASAFFVFMEDFRKQYKEKHPNNKSVSVVGKAGGEKWKSMSEAEKARYACHTPKSRP